MLRFYVTLVLCFATQIASTIVSVTTDAEIKNAVQAANNADNNVVATLHEIKVAEKTKSPMVLIL